MLLMKMKSMTQPIVIPEQFKSKLALTCLHSVTNLLVYLQYLQSQLYGHGYGSLQRKNAKMDENLLKNLTFSYA